MSYLEFLATMYVVVTTCFSVSAFRRDRVLTDNKNQIDSLYKSLNEYKDSNKFLLQFYHSHNANKNAEVKT